MSHAWLDSLSEDWVSQPRSDTSQGQLPSFSSPPAHARSKSVRETASRIPRLHTGNAGTRRPQPPPRDGSISALSERSPNDINIKGSQSALSKLSQEMKLSQRGRHLSRSVSASTAGSVVHNTVQHKSQSASPSKGKEQAPEWKRRLLYGELDYGDSKDLFSSAGTGLANMFKPPVEHTSPEEESNEDEAYTVNETTLPSSPPPYLRFRRDQLHDDETQDLSVNDSSIQHAPPLPKQMAFRRTEDDTKDMSVGPESTLEGSRDEQATGTNAASETSITSLNVMQRLDASRKISGQSDVRNEDLSPILISRHNTGDGKISYAPIDLPAQQLRKQLEKLRMSQMILESELNSDPDRDTGAVGDGTQTFENTDDYAKNGGFLNLERVGRSGEGSFRRRPLSPSVNTDTSEMLPESSLQASTPKQFPTIRTDRYASAERIDEPTSPVSPVVPRAPHPSPEKRLQPPPGHSGSPLKLFGPYDTFTNQTLLRRISQFEDQISNSPPRSTEGAAVASPMPDSLPKPDTNEGFVGMSSSGKMQHHISHAHHETFGAINRFGAGELDGYEFDEDISLSSNEPSRFEDKENMTPAETRVPSNHPLKFEIHNDHSSDGESLVVQRQRHRSSSSLSSKHRLGATKSVDGSQPRTASDTKRETGDFQTTPQREGSEGKRPRTSPTKDPTPKRRRTLHRSDIAYGLEDRPAAIEPVQSSHYSMQSAIGRKRKDVRYGEMQQVAEPSILAMRQILRPRSPTPSQKMSAMRERQPLGDIGLNLDDGHSEISTQDQTSPGFAQDFAVDGSRKTSMKTQDFYDAAEEIMAMIRNKARPRTDLASVEESEVESSEHRSYDTSGAIEDSFQESTREPFSRPPSREGRPVSRMPVRQEDPELADRLRKYEEQSDVLGGIISHSIQSMGRIQDAIHGTNSFNESIERSVRADEMRRSSHDDEEVISDLSNVRISRNPDRSTAGENVVEFPSNGSRSSGASTGRSVPTGSSRGSDSRRLIAPDVVNALIGDHVGNMVFDKENKRWQKVKTPRPSRVMNVLPSEDSEEDPFASIPDLSVDAVKENRNLGLVTGQNLDDLQQFLQDDAPPGDSSEMAPTVGGEATDARSIMSHTRDTFTRVKRTLVETAVEDDEEIEHEITIHEDRMQNSSPSRRRNLTITFSSPIASIIQDVAHRSDEDNTDRDLNSMDQAVGTMAADSIRRGRHNWSNIFAKSGATRSKSRSRSRGVSRNLSVRGNRFVPRPVSRIDERDEDASAQQATSEQQRQLSICGESSLVGPEPEDRRNKSLNFVVTTPAPPRTAPNSGTPVIGKYVGTLSLSPLSEFTMHQADESCGLEVSYVVGNEYLMTGDGSKKVMSKAIRSLVEKITEVEPFEPDWESMRELDISNKQLETLHMLDEFCTSVVTLDASNNAIGHVDGVPGSVRNLRLAHNQLSELTAWGHLMNLQYVDVSNNQINSLYAFKDLVHLRTLRADNNQITSLDGIKFHDSLQVLRARGNLIEEIDLDGTKMQRLTELDLESNQIDSIHNIEQLSCLITLNLQHNRVASFAPSTDYAMPHLKYLKLSDNELSSLDLSATPSLHLLHADRNRLTTVTGFSRCRRLDSLSLREQNGNATLDTCFLNSAYEVRKLFLSGNLLSDFNPQMDFLNLQYLELANCGLQSLPPHLGQLMPNLRVVNLNFNAIENLSGLRYIPRLKKLLVAGNRLADAGEVANVLAEFPHLSRLDFRDNPVTLGFYPPVQTLVPVERSGNEGEFDPFMLPDVDVDRDEKYISRLDMGTRMRKRLYEMVVVERCYQLKLLDGLPVARDSIQMKDRVWEALVTSGVIDDGCCAEETDAGTDAADGETLL
ncbi:Uu.00g064130.m01.CDS01 [Anthostomella pinea]|uniref:Uu.00g064130.m01.CDS01 n=1 Tax=Anthostomella pinea TaxID=933095 RepID=A0AAI8YN16_9PEZI|nr:Uu.00g064130.m01.CDS01 [Anthostomella pinea]